MASYFNLTLDTTAPSSPSITIAGGAGTTTSFVNTCTISTGDGDTTGYQMKIWGDVDTTYDSNVQSSENGTAQVETATVTGGATADANVIVTVTASGMTNSPKAINVAVLNADTASDVAGKIRTALGLDADVSAFFTVGGTGADVALTVITIAADDATMNIAIDGTTNTTGVPDAATSADTTAGVAASSWITYATSKDVKLATPDGTKTVYLKIRDDVGNATTETSDSILLDSTSPVVAIMTGPTPSKISKVSGWNVSAIEWQVDEIFDEYKVMVVPSTGAVHDNGSNVQLPTTAGSSNVSGTAGSYPATTNITTNVYGTDLETASAGDGVKIVKVFVQDVAGNWSV